MAFTYGSLPRGTKADGGGQSASHSGGLARRPAVHAMSHSPIAALSPELRSALVAMVRKRVPESEVEDIVQATLADAFASPHAPPEPEAFRRWVFGVAKNKVVDFHRRRGRESFDVPEVAGGPAPHSEVDMLRWAERNLPPGEENKTTLDWMLREGEGEKLEWIAESEKMPAPRVRQRVSRLRRHLKDHWKKEVALLATVGVLLTGLVLLLRPKPVEPIANEDVPRAEELRKQAFEKCLGGDFKPCMEKLDDAKRLDPAGDTAPAVKQARDNADRALRLPPPVPTTSATTSDILPAPPPVPTDSPKMMKEMKTAPGPKSTATALPSSWPTPLTTEQIAPPKPSPPKKSQPKSSNATDFPDNIQSKEPSGAKKKSAPPTKGGSDFGSL